MGPVWYQRSVWVPAGWRAVASCCIWSPPPTARRSGSTTCEVVSHEGGYLPFEVDVTDHVRPGAEVRLSVEVDNTLSFQTIPPGVVEDTPHGKRQRYWHDFFNYAGLHRSVWLYATDPIHLDDVTVGPIWTGRPGWSATTTVVAGQSDGSEVAVVLRDADGNEVAAGAGAAGTLTVPDVKRWPPGTATSTTWSSSCDATAS